MEQLDNRIQLAYYFKELGFSKGAEIGVARGIYSEKLCEIIPNLELYCIDPWDTYAGNQRGGRRADQYYNYQVALKKLSKYHVHFIRKVSMEAVLDFKRASLDFVFIDGNHNYEYVLEDITEWSKKVRKNGIVAGHDYYHFRGSGVVEAVDEYVAAHDIDLQLTKKNVKSSPLDDKNSSWWFKK